jgi:predicted regulator of Ras-like GTPase activity (Roadblock/LC7/MglB family)
MNTLRDVVRGLAAREGVEAVVIVSGDGLPIDHAGRSEFDPEAVSALTATVAQGARSLGRALEGDRLTTGVLEFGDRLVIFSALSEDHLLFILPTRGTNTGALLYDLRRHAPAVAALL